MVRINDLDVISPMQRIGEKQLHAHRIEFYDSVSSTAQGPTMILIDKNNDVQTTLWNSTLIGDQNGYIFFVGQPTSTGQPLQTFVFDREANEYYVSDINPVNNGDAML